MEISPVVVEPSVVEPTVKEPPMVELPVMGLSVNKPSTGRSLVAVRLMLQPGGDMLVPKQEAGGHVMGVHGLSGKLEQTAPKVT